MKTSRENALAAIHEITTRPELLTVAAAGALAAWQRDHVVGHDGDRVARMLIAAGADEPEVLRLAEERRRMPRP